MADGRLIVMLAALLGACGPGVAPKKVVSVRAEMIEDKIRGGLLGQILGDLNGLKHEMEYIAQPGNVTEYTPSLPNGAWTDDDTDIEWVYVMEMERSRTLLLPPARIADLWRAHINRRIWCSHQYVRQLMSLGIEPPLTGMIHVNPWADFNLSGQFMSETWGLISPGMPQSAARLGLHYTHVSIDLEAAQSTQLFTTMIAVAFLDQDIEKIIDAGVQALDPTSVLAQVAKDVRTWHAAYPHDWRATRRQIQEKYSHYGGDDLRDRNGVELNAASTLAALLYGQGDFVETIRHAFNFGWDCDNNAATSGTILGVIKGERWIKAQGWDIQDGFRNTSRDDVPDDETITRFGSRLVTLAGLQITGHGGSKDPEGRDAVYRIPVEQSQNVEPLPDPSSQFARLRAAMKPTIEDWLDQGSTSQARARAAYLAICLDLAPAMRQQHPRQWEGALAALGEYPNVLQVLFFDSPFPAGDRIRKAALAAGVVTPTTQTKLW